MLRAGLHLGSGSSLLLCLKRALFGIEEDALWMWWYSSYVSVLLVGFLPLTRGSETCGSDTYHSGHTLAYG